MTSKAAVATYTDTVAAGQDRAKFFDIPLCAMTTPEVKQQKYDDDSGKEIKNNSTHEPKIKTIGCQTVYREQSAQTRPYFPMPPFRSDKDLPEVVLIADLIEGDRNPGRYEVDLVIRSRKRRNWEKLMQKLPESVIKQNERRLILEAFEWENWLSREEGIENEQLERLDYVQQKLNERTQMNATSSVGRLHVSIERVTSNYERDIARIQ